MSQENVEVVEQMIAALNARDLDRYLARCTPDVEYVSPIAPIEGAARGEEGLRAYFATIAEATTSFHIQIDELRPLGADRVLALTRFTAVSQGGIPADQPTASLYDFAGAKVRRIEIFLDRAEALEAAGLSEYAMSQENVETVRQIFDAYNRGDYDAAVELVHPDVEMVPPGGQSPYRGRHALRKWMEPDAFATQTVEVREVTLPGDRILVHAHSWNTGASSGIELELDFWSVWSFDDAGLVTRAEVFLDRQLALEAAGLSE